MNGRPEIKAKLLASAAVLALVDTYLTKPAIYTVPLVAHDTVEGTISMYRSSSVDGGDVVKVYSNTVNCWAMTYDKVEALQDAVFLALNEKLQESTYFICTSLEVIPASELAVEYNAPIEVLVRQRT